MTGKLRYAVQIDGLVQGVGMRPFIYRTAKSANITGYVKNQGASVMLDITGSQNDIDSFIAVLFNSPPRNAVIQQIRTIPLEYACSSDFVILDSAEAVNPQGLLLPDLPVCDECVKDIKNSMDRRYRYAFTGCSGCGPRYTILKALPYDRHNTSMQSFDMCGKCREEYENPGDRRFHAQPVCCPDCGPAYRLFDRDGTEAVCDDPAAKTVRLLKDGNIIAVKGIGGYHLVCDAENDKAVLLLRQKKNRPDRPFAVMACDIESVREICKLNKKEEETISNNIRPIILLKKSEKTILSDAVAPRLNRYGVMLPYTPLHHMLFDRELRYLVMTSGNRGGMPICYKDGDAFEKLSGTADYFLVHNREIMTPADDSVVKVTKDNEVMISRSGRGYAPYAIKTDSADAVLACGGEQKASICLVVNGFAHLSQYIGDLGDESTCAEYTEIINRMTEILKANPRYAAHDLHPGYYSARFAGKSGFTNIPIQHHHAHMAGCMAENNLTHDTIGVIYDGTGMGNDGAVWGGEILIGTRARFKRAGHLEYVHIQGGDSAVREIWRCAVSYLYASGTDSAPYFDQLGPARIRFAERALSNNVNCFQSSSMGRLFDCIAALVLKRTHVTYDAQAAIELESILDPAVKDQYSCNVFDIGGELIIGCKEIIAGVLQDISMHKPASYISAKFHNTVCSMTVNCVRNIGTKNNIYDIVLSGGVFENAYLFSETAEKLKKAGFNVYSNKRVPVNDGGLSFGQAAAAIEIIKESSYVPGSSRKDFVNQ